MGDIWSTVLLFALMGGALYFLMIRPQQKRQKEQQNLMGSLEPGSRVMLISGIIATVKYLGDKQAVVEIAPGVEMTVDKRAISTQPVVDEFEYADDADVTDADVSDDVEPATLEPDVDAAAPAVVEPEPAEVVEDVSDATWDQPGTGKN